VDVGLACLVFDMVQRYVTADSLQIKIRGIGALWTSAHCECQQCSKERGADGVAPIEVGKVTYRESGVGPDCNRKGGEPTIGLGYGGAAGRSGPSVFDRGTRVGV
jgi:hypothetical protein